MNDERLLREVGTWLQDGDREPPDARRSVKHAMQRMPRVRQRSRWWPFPIFYRRAQTPTATDTTEYQPSPIPASNGHTPTVIGRTTSMLSPVKAITAGALVFAIGGVMLVAQPFQQAANVPGAETPEPPVAVSGSATGGDCPVEDTVEVAEGLTTFRDGYCNPRWLLDDSRFDGTVTWALHSDAYPDVDGVTVGTLGVSVVNDEGAWRMVPEVMYGTDGTVWPDPSLPSQFVMVGEDGYDGYYAVFTFDKTSPISGTLEGFIVQGEPPPAPEAAGGS